MKIWNAVPLLRVLIPFISGIVTAVWLPVDNYVLLLALFFIFIIIVPLNFTRLWKSAYRYSWWYGAWMNAVFFLLAYELTIFKTDQFSAQHFSTHCSGSQIVLVRIASPCVEKERSVKAVVECIAMNHNGALTPVFGKALVYFQKDTRALSLNSGDELILKANFKEIEPAQNPAAFDYRRFLFYKNIYKRAYVHASDWVYTGVNSEYSLVRYSIALRTELLRIFKAAQLQNDEFAVAAALLVGYTDKLDEELLSAYSKTGTLHVLSVSGMHVAIVFMVFSRFLFFLDNMKKGPLIKAVVLIFFLWFYALLTGLSPSVLRSATMFSFIVCARSFKRNSSIYNTLAASALFLLLINPYLIMDVGFQLSYLAVVGILLIQPFFERWVRTDNWLLEQLGTLVTVSITAQLATLPVSLYYFHQFPNYFLLSNLVVIPLSTCIIYLGMLLILVAGNTYLLSHVSLIFSKTLAFLNASVVYIRDLPHAVTDGISITAMQVYLLYGFMVYVFLYFHKKKYHHLKTALCMAIAGLGIQVCRQAEQQQQKKMIVYAIPKMSCIDFIAGQEHVLLTDTSYQEKAGTDYMQSNWCSSGLHPPVIASTHMRTANLFINEEAIQFYSKRIILLREAKKIKELKKCGKSATADCVVVSKNVNIRMEEVIAVYRPGCIVMDLSNSAYRCEKWKKECEVLHQPFYSLADSGAYTIEL